MAAETINEAITRKENELARVRKAIERIEENGTVFSSAGTSVQQAQYTELQKREQKIERTLASLRSRLDKDSPNPRFAVTKSKSAN